ncbi:recombination-associated protein [Proteus phage Q29]|nr:recombination-associated protein [Proteus phage Q29]
MKPFDKFIAFAISEPADPNNTTSFSALANGTEDQLKQLGRELETRLRNLPIGDPSAMQWTRHGFAKPDENAEPITVVDEVLGDMEDTPYVMIDEAGKYLVFTFEERARMLSPTTIKDELEVKVKDWIERVGDTPTKRERNDMRDEIINDLLPKATIKRTKTYAMIIKGVLIVFAGSNNIGEKVASAVRKVVGSLPIVPWFEHSALITEFLKKIATVDFDPEDAVGQALDKFEIVRSAKVSAETGAYTFKDVFDITNDVSFKEALGQTNGYSYPLGITEANLELRHDATDSPIGFVLTAKGVLKSVNWNDEPENIFDDSVFDTNEERERARFIFSTWDAYTLVTAVLGALHNANANRFVEDDM